ncbi:MAG: hypothetical protein K2Z80_18245 [Xanthobacteraceae bacterium]|nr:hypothetical protein [Xanthobacteraceae bacterium]
MGEVMPMSIPLEDTPKEISEVTRRAIIDHFGVANISWAGRLQDDEFLSRLYDLTKRPSFDHRYKDAAGDIYQHCVRNNDWDSGWVFYDRRFNLLHAPDAEFLQFLCETLHPIVRPSDDEVTDLLAVYNGSGCQAPDPASSCSIRPSGRAAHSHCTWTIM